MVHMSEAGHTRAKHFNYVAAIAEEVLLWKPVGKMFFFSLIGGPHLTSFPLNVRKEFEEPLKDWIFF